MEHFKTKVRNIISLEEKREKYSIKLNRLRNKYYDAPYDEFDKCRAEYRKFQNETFWPLCGQIAEEFNDLKRTILESDNGFLKTKVHILEYQENILDEYNDTFIRMRSEEKKNKYWDEVLEPQMDRVYREKKNFFELILSL